MEVRRFSSLIFATIVGLVALAFVSMIGFCVTQSIRSDGEIKYCYVSLTSPAGLPPVYMLHGFRPWRVDRYIGAYMKLDDAIEAAQKIQCTMKQVPKF